MEIEPEQQRDINMNLLARVHKLEQELKDTQEHTLKIFVSNAEVMEEFAEFMEEFAEAIEEFAEVIEELINRIKKLEEHAK